MRRAARKDDNQDEIVQALRAVGASVFPTHQLGGGFVDLVIGYKGTNYLAEIKDGNKPPSRRKLTRDEQLFFDTWRGTAHVIETVEQALFMIGVTYAKPIPHPNP